VLRREIRRAYRGHEPLFGSPETLRVTFDVSTIDALKESKTQRVERVVSLVGAGILTVDEARAGEDLKPLRRIGQAGDFGRPWWQSR